MVTEGKAIFSAKGTKQDVVRPLYFGLEYTIGDLTLESEQCDVKERYILRHVHSYID